MEDAKTNRLFLRVLEFWTSFDIRIDKFLAIF